MNSDGKIIEFSGADYNSLIFAAANRPPISKADFKIWDDFFSDLVEAQKVAEDNGTPDKIRVLNEPPLRLNLAERLLEFAQRHPNRDNEV